MNVDRMIAPPPRWAVRCTWLIPLLIVPSAVWRTSLLFRGTAFGDGGWYLALLSVLSLALGVATVVLVRPWGAWCPPWLPLLGGTLLMLVSLYAAWNSIFGLIFEVPPALNLGGGHHPKPGPDVMALYAPMLAWGPLLILVTVDYRRRRA